MKRHWINPLRGLCPPNPLGFSAWEPSPQSSRHAWAAGAAQTCGLWTKRCARVASQRSPILRLGIRRVLENTVLTQSRPEPGGQNGWF